MVAFNRYGLSSLATLAQIQAPPNSPVSNLPHPIQSSCAFLANALLARLQIDAFSSMPDGQAPLLETTAPTRPTSVLEPLSYNQGDQAQTVEQFAKELSGEYRVRSNSLAKQPERFNQQCLVIYGEIHTDVKIPSLRNGKGILLSESDDPNLWLAKHQSHASNRMVHLDNQTDAEIAQRYAPLMTRLTDLIHEIDSEALSKIYGRADATTSGHTILNQMLEFVEQHFDEAKARKLQWEIPFFEKRLQDVRTIYTSIERQISENLQARDQHMIGVASRAISQLAPDESATVVVGARHVRPLADALHAQFGHAIPIVTCLPGTLDSKAFMPTRF